MKSQIGSYTLEQQINDYLLTASGHLKETEGGFIDARRVASYGAAAGSALVMMSQAEAVVIPNAGTARPVTVVGTSSTVYAPFDMNGDGVNDFALFGYSYSSSFSAGINGTPGSGANNSVLGAGNVRKLASGATIGPTPPGGLSWQTARSTLRDVFLAQNSGRSFWNGSADETGFAGVRFKIAGRTHYGWIKLRVNSAGSLTALAWAYEGCPDTPISAGATTGGATCAVTPVPAMGLPALGLAALALGAMGLANLRRRRDQRKSV